MEKDNKSHQMNVVNTMTERPSVMYKPKLFLKDGSWVALYGDNLQGGVAGFGKSPAAAMADFDIEWIQELK